MKTLIIGTEQHKIICTGVAVVSPAARTINYLVVCFTLIWQFGNLARKPIYTEWFHNAKHN